MVVWLFLTVRWVCLQFVVVVFRDHAGLLSLRPVFYQVIELMLIFLPVTAVVNARINTIEQNVFLKQLKYHTMMCNSSTPTRFGVKFMGGSRGGQGVQTP